MSFDRKFGRAMAIWFVIYILILLPSLTFTEQHLDSSWRFVVAVLPMIPLVFIARETVKHLARMDELHRRIQLTSLAMTVLITALVTLTYGFLERAGFPRVSVLWVWPFMAAIWAVTRFVAQRRYYS